MAPRRVEGWIEQGFIKPAIAGKGPGRRNLFSLDQVILGAFILELQASFGEKSALVGMFSENNRAEGLIRAARKYAQEDKQFIFGMSLKAGHLRELAHPDVGISPPLMLAFLKEAMAKGYTVCFINVSAIVGRFTSDKKN